MMDNKIAWILVRGGGDLASGVILRLVRSGLHVYVAELPQPLAVRRLVSFAQAVYDGEVRVEDRLGRRIEDANQAEALAQQGITPVLIDPGAESRHYLHPLVVIDARMTKSAPDLGLEIAPLVIGLGPGFTAPVNCHAVVETRRGHYLGRVIWEGTAEPDTGLPETVGERQHERVLRAPTGGTLRLFSHIGDQVETGQVVADVNGNPIRAEFTGIIRGLLQDGLPVQTGLKIGDIDPRLDPQLPYLVSDKSLAIGGGVLEAMLSRADVRRRLWEG